MKKKLLWCAGIVVLIVLIALGVFRYIEVRHHQTDPNWKLAEQIYKENSISYETVILKKGLELHNKLIIDKGGHFRNARP